MHVIKSSGKTEKFHPEKTRKWVSWAIGNELPLEKRLEMEYEILKELMSRISDGCTTEDIHNSMISVCLDKKQLDYSKVAANLEQATLYKNIEKELRIIQPEKENFSNILDVMVSRNLWAGDWVSADCLAEHEKEIDELYIELASMPLQVWTVKQWADKYSIKLSGNAVETPAMGILALALSLHGWTEKTAKMARGVLAGKQNYPTPMLNGCRNGNYNLISCCVIEADDSTMSIDLAELIASQMTARKAGIGINLKTRSKGDAVKNGAVTHLGKHPLYMSLQSTVKKYTQETRGGSATTTFNALDPEIFDELLWKTQRIDLSRRLDKLDFELAYNDAFGIAVINDDDWYLMSYDQAPEVWDNFHTTADEYNKLVKEAILRGAKYTKVKALDIVTTFADTRFETGRQYINNLTYTNLHTPFNDPAKPITQSNLCEEIALPTKGFGSIEELLDPNAEGEVAFCTIAAGNVEKISEEEYMDEMETLVYTLNIALDKASVHAVTPALKASLLRRRSLGVGMTGLAGKLYSEGLDYDGSEESLQAVFDLAELHYFSLLAASQKYAAETGTVVTEGIDINWLPKDTMRSKRTTRLDWESLRGKPRANSVLAALMPTESSSGFSGATNGPYPSRKKVISKKARTGKFQFISEHFDPDKHISVWDPALRMDLYYGEIQAHTDQAISADYYTAFHNYANSKIPMEQCVIWFIRQFLAGNKTAYYQNFLDTETDEEIEEVEENDDCCKL